MKGWAATDDEMLPDSGVYACVVMRSVAEKKAIAWNSGEVAARREQILYELISRRLLDDLWSTVVPSPFLVTSALPSGLEPAFAPPTTPKPPSPFRPFDQPGPLRLRKGGKPSPGPEQLHKRMSLDQGAALFPDRKFKKPRVNCVE